MGWFEGHLDTRKTLEKNAYAFEAYKYHYSVPDNNVFSIGLP